MKRLTPPAGHIGCIVFLICAASMLSRAQSPYLPIPNGEWDKIITLDTAFIRISYEMTFRDALPYSTSEPNAIKSHIFTEDEMITDTRMVEIGTKCRKDYSYILETAEQENKKLTEKGILPNAGCPPVRPFEMFIYDCGKITVSYRTLMHGPILKFEDICESMQWSLTGEADQVGDYQCQKAVTSFGGRKWTAWFCPDIPVDGGPYKFRGLPGLILKVEDSEKHFSWTMTGIEKGSWPIYEKQYLFQECSPKEAGKILQNMFLHPFTFMKNAGVKIMMRDGKGGFYEPGEKENSISMYYDPIELE